MINPYNQPYISIRDKLNPINETTQDAQKEIYSHLVEIIHDEFSPRFKTARQKEYEGIKSEGGVVQFLRSKLLKRNQHYQKQISPMYEITTAQTPND